MPKRPVLSFSTAPASTSSAPGSAAAAPASAAAASSAGSAPVASTIHPQDHREPGSAPRWRVGVGAVVVVVLALLAFGIVVSAVTSASEAHATGVGDSSSPAESPLGGATPAPTAPSGRGPVPTEQSAGSVFVHILGQVVRPGLYEVEPGARAVDVLSAAGGFTRLADRAALNLARPVVDGEQIVVPKPGEVPPPLAETAADGSRGATGSAEDPTGAPVDLNTADAATLETLSGVGPATAQAILDWRAENGRFESVDDLLDVTGIGDKKLEAVRDSVTVG